MAHKFDIHVLSRDQEAIRAFNENNPCIPSAKFHVNPSSVFEIISEIIFSDVDYAVFCHDDVTYPSSIAETVSDLISKLNTAWPNWGIAGNSGVSTVRNVCDNKIVRYAIQNDRMPTNIGHILPAETIEGNTILLNCRSLREAKVIIPDFFGMHDYDTILSVATLYAGLSVLICPELACFYKGKSYPATSIPIHYSNAFLSFLSSRITNRYLTTARETFAIPKTSFSDRRYDINRVAIENASKGRSIKLGIITRTQFRSLPLLNRTIESVKEFRKASISNIAITHYIATDVLDVIDFPGSDGVTVLHYPDVKRQDSRKVLIQRAVHEARDDFILLLDDDDWLFPNEAHLLSAILASVPPTGSVVIESQQFEEVFEPVTGEPLSRGEKPIHVFRSDNWQQNFSGINHIPSCGIFYSRELMAEVPEESFNSVTYFEDFAISSFVLLNPKAIFFNVPVLATGISVRLHSEGIIKNTITEKDRTTWNQSLAELAHVYINQNSNNVLRDLGKGLAERIEHNRYAVQKSRLSSQVIYLSRLDRLTLVISRFTRGLLRFSIKPHQYNINLRRFLLATRSNGFRGLVRAVVDTR